MLSGKTIAPLLLGVMSMMALALVGANAQAASSEAKVITFTQTGCQFVESESKDHGFKPTSGDDCKAINAESGAKRLADSKTLKLEPGKYIFRVTNQNVPYELGFYLRGTGLGRLVLPKISGGGLHTGVTQDYEIELKEGRYVYSCPLNPTPDYNLVVKSKG